MILPNGEPISEAVIEVYEYSVSDKELPAYEVEHSKKRKTACLTGERGEFCIPRLSAGKYLLKVGTRRCRDKYRIHHRQPYSKPS